jgi:hypothetical protein
MLTIIDQHKNRHTLSKKRIIYTKNAKYILTNTLERSKIDDTEKEGFIYGL